MGQKFNLQAKIRFELSPTNQYFLSRKVLACEVKQKKKYYLHFLEIKQTFSVETC